MKNNKIIPTEKIEDSKIREEIEKFKFFAQYADFKGLKTIKMEIYHIIPMFLVIQLSII